VFLNNHGLCFHPNHLCLQKAVKEHMRENNYVIAGAKDEKTMVTEIKYISVANCALRNSVTHFLTIRNIINSFSDIPRLWFL
jgi:hypothetical protein